MKSVRGWVGIACALWLIQGCAPESEQEGTLCEQAAAHVGACLPGESVADLGACTDESAQQLLDQSCAALQAEVGGGKSDAWCNPLFFWRACHDGVSIDLHSCFEGQCDWSDGYYSSGSCFEYRVVNTSGDVVHQESTRSGSTRFDYGELEDGDYAVQVLRRDGSVASFMIDYDDATNDFNPLVNYDEEEHSPRFSIVDGEIDRERIDLILHQDEASTVHVCGTFEGFASMTCDGEVLAEPRQEGEWSSWDWYVTLSPVSEDAFVGEPDEVYSLFRDNRLPDSDMTPREYRFSSFDTGAGVYEVAFHRVEVPADDFFSYGSTYTYGDDEKFEEIATRSRYALDLVQRETVTIDGDEYGGRWTRVRREFTLDYADTCPER